MAKDLLIELFNLSKRMNSHGGKVEESMLERYKYFLEHSKYGKDCSYARKCKDLFLTHDYPAVRQLFLDILVLFREVEGNDFGK